MIIKIKETQNKTFYALNEKNETLISGYNDIELLKCDIMVLLNNDNICFITDKDAYNGWSNHSTWNANLWIKNIERLYYHFKNIKSFEVFKYDLKNTLEHSTLIKDKINPIEINYYEIFLSFNE